MLINTAFSHIRKSAPPYFLVITHQTKASDDIDELMQERLNSTANALKYVFLTPSHPYKECHLWVTPHPPTPTPPHPHPQPLIISFNAMKSIRQCLKILFYLINAQCTEHITSHYIVLRHTDSTILDSQIRDTQPPPPIPILTSIIEVKLTLSSHSTLFPRHVTDIVLL